MSLVPALHQLSPRFGADLSLLNDHRCTKGTEHYHCNLRDSLALNLEEGRQIQFSRSNLRARHLRLQ